MEQALVFASIILGVAVSDQVMSLHRLLRSPQPIQWHWAQPWFALIVLMTDMMFWWAIVGQQRGAVSIGGFLPKVIELILLALLTLNSLPDDLTEDGTDLKSYYQTNSRYQWLLLAGAFGWSTLVDVVGSAKTLSAAVHFVGIRAGDIFAIIMIVFLAFVRRWWGVALGLALVSIAPVLWLARTIS